MSLQGAQEVFKRGIRDRGRREGAAASGAPGFPTKLHLAGHRTRSRPAKRRVQTEGALAGMGPRRRHPRADTRAGSGRPAPRRRLPPPAQRYRSLQPISAGIFPKLKKTTWSRVCGKANNWSRVCGKTCNWSRVCGEFTTTGTASAAK